MSRSPLMSTGADIMLFYKGVTFFPFLHRIYMRIENSFFSSIHYPPSPSGTAVGGKGLKYLSNHVLTYFNPFSIYQMTFEFCFFFFITVCAYISLTKFICRRLIIKLLSFDKRIFFIYDYLSKCIRFDLVLLNYVCIYDTTVKVKC